MVLELDGEYPVTPPKGYFKTKIFHPNVSASGEICVNTLKKDWKAELGIKEVLLVKARKKGGEKNVLNTCLLLDD